MATAFAQAANNSPYSNMRQNTTPSPPQSYYPGNASPQTPPSSNQSPTSYHAHLHVRQLRPQKQPLYTPACLRPTESSRPKDIPGPRAPDTPPSSKQSSFDNGNVGLDVPDMSNTTSQESDLDMLRQGLSRAASESIDEEYGDVSGPPTVAHWKVCRHLPIHIPIACCVFACWYISWHRCSEAIDDCNHARAAALIHALPRARNASRNRNHYGLMNTKRGVPTYANHLAYHISLMNNKANIASHSPMSLPKHVLSARPLSLGTSANTTAAAAAT